MIHGTARIAHGDVYKRQEKEIKKKYGIQFMLIVGFGRLTRLLRRKENSSCGVVITVDA